MSRLCLKMQGFFWVGGKKEDLGMNPKLELRLFLFFDLGTKSELGFVIQGEWCSFELLNDIFRLNFIV